MDVLSRPVYDEVVKEFFEAAEQDCWIDFGYVPDQAGPLLSSEDGVDNGTAEPRMRAP